MPHVASKASVLKPQHSGLTQRERMPESKDSTSPFSLLLSEAGSEAAPSRPNSSRPNGTAASQRTEPPRSHMRRTDAERPQQANDDSATDAPEAATTEAAATEQGDAEAAKPFEIAVVGQAAVPPELSGEPVSESTSDDADGKNVTIDATLAALVETPPPPAQPVVLDTPAPAVAVTPAAAAPTDPGTVESTAAAGVTAAAPAAAIAAVTPDATLGATEPAPQAPQAPQAAPVPQAPQAPEQTARSRRPSRQRRRPSRHRPRRPRRRSPQASRNRQRRLRRRRRSYPLPARSTPKPNPRQRNQRTARRRRQPSTRQHGPNATERPQTASAVSDFVQAAQQPTPDWSHLAHLQTGRDFGQAVAATAHASQGADASNSLMSAQVPLESLAVAIASRAQGGSNRFEIRLDPPELGRIDVRLDIDRSGNVTSRLVVEKAETLDVLRRDAHQLERALQDAGLKTSDNGMQFSLRDQSSADRNDRNGSNNPRVLIADPELPAAEGATVAYGLTLRGGSGIDIRV